MIGSGIRGGVLVGVLGVFIFATSILAKPGFGDCSNSDCHGGNSSMTSTPANGSNLAFGYALVGSNKTAGWTVKNSSTDNQTGLSGNFPAGVTEFTPTSTLAFTTNNGGYLTKGQSVTRTSTYTPTARGADTLSRTLVGDLGSTTSSVTINFTGQGVAPIAVKNDAGFAASLVRLGTSKSLSLVIQNTGDGNLAGAGIGNLAGTVPASTGVFTGAGGSISVADAGSQSFTFTFTPTDRTAQNKSLTLNFTNGKPDGTNAAHTMTASLSGTGIGPIFASTGDTGGVINVGTVPIDWDVTKVLTVRNAATEVGMPAALNDLTLLSRSITGAGASAVSTPNFSAGQVLAALQSQAINVKVHPMATGAFTATLSFVTDENAAKGATGLTKSFTIQGTARTGGDANQDNLINIDDYFIVDQSYARHTVNPGWAGGDFDQNGVIDGSDYFLIDRGFASGPLSAGSPTAVPEPAAALLLLAGAAMLLRRRR